MLKSTLAVTSVTLMLMMSHAQAQTPAACTEAEMTKMDGEIGKMTDATKKAEMMKEMAMAKDMMAKKDMAGCATHMDMAAKMMPKM